MRDTSLDIDGFLDGLADRVANRIAERIRDRASESRFEDEPQDEPATAAWLKMSPQSLKRLRKSGQVPFIRAGTRIAYLPSAVLASLHELPKGGAA